MNYRQLKKWNVSINLPSGDFKRNLEAPPPKYQDGKSKKACLIPPKFYHRLIQHTQNPDLFILPSDEFNKKQDAPPLKYQDAKSNNACLIPPKFYHRLIQISLCPL
ncbi:hypothetical protein RUM43_009320 [Polyplax serrata]|uniref:Uncharacterized protein n=1 Tax=Polyplax serrata TaxID=468196 RepID=A0AAN8PIA4_POLSC